jgi:hypothetical protein
MLGLTTVNPFAEAAWAAREQNTANCSSRTWLPSRGQMSAQDSNMDMELELNSALVGPRFFNTAVTAIRL